MTTVSSWINIMPGKAETRGRLFCLPYAGGGTAVYYKWRDSLPDDIEIVRIQLPGRETRIREKPYTRLEPLVSALVREVMPLLDHPFFFFGHSMGALVAFELARRLRRNHSLIPMHLFVSGRRAPQLPDPEPPVCDLSDTEFIERLCQYQGIPDMVLNNAELLELFLPILRADFDLLDHYEHISEPPLACPITAYGGVSDPKINREDILAWNCHTSLRFENHFFSGGHFYLNESTNLLLDHINKTMHLSLLSN